MRVTPYGGLESESLPTWLCEVDTAIRAKKLTDPNLQVSLALSFLKDRARRWAFGKLLRDINCFPSLEAFRRDILASFQPPQSEFRARTRFLALKQESKELIEYAQEARELIAQITERPIDEETQVNVFVGGLRKGAIRTYLFREYPESLEEAIQQALNEEFSLKASRLQEPLQRRPPATHRRNNGPEPMDLSQADRANRATARVHSRANGNGVPGKDGKKCHRCGRFGHFARECRAPKPAGDAPNAHRVPRFGRGGTPPNAQDQ